MTESPSPAARHLHPVSPAQRRLWFLEQAHPNRALYNITWILEIEGGLAPAFLARAVAEVTSRHAVLRTSLEAVDGEPMQRVVAGAQSSLPVVDLSRLTTAVRAREGERLAHADEATSFDLSRSPLFRTTLVRFDARRHQLRTVFHHTVADGWSLRLFATEVETLYGAFARNRAPDLAPLPLQYTDYARRRWSAAQSEGAAEDLAFWRRHFAGSPDVLSLPTDRRRSAEPGTRAGWEPLAVPPEIMDRLSRIGREAGGGLFVAGLAAFYAYLHHVTGEEDLIVGFPVRGRTGEGETKLIGFFVRTLALRLRTVGSEPFQELVERVREGFDEVRAHDRTPFHEIVEAVRPHRGTSHNPLFQVMFVLQNRPPEDTHLPGGQVVSHRILEHSAAKFDLTFNLTPHTDGRGLAGGIEYHAGLFHPTTAKRFARRFETLLRSVASRPDVPVHQLQVMPPTEEHAVALEWAGSGATPSRLQVTRPSEDDPRISMEAPDRGLGHGRRARLSAEPVPVHEQVAERARRAPDAVAVAGGGRWLSYGELERRASRLARRLQGLGVGPEEPVAVCLDRSPAEVTTLLAVLKAGGAYLPLDPSQPTGRLLMLLEDSGAPWVVTDESGADRLSASTALPVVPERREPVGAVGRAEPTPGVRVLPEHLAYVIYTSGSTGRPKGVQVRHAGLSHLVAWHLRAFDVGPGDRATRLSGLGFDASVWELWPYLAAGATVQVPADRETRLAPEALQSWLTAERITISFVSTPVAEALLSLEWSAEASLRTLLTGGDRLVHYPSPTLPFELVNDYGPTENTVVATHCTVAAAGGAAPPPPIGRPCDHVRVYLVSRDGALAPVGTPGEMWLGGPGLARGYLGRPAWTAEAFVPNPFGGSPGDRLYRTGDLAHHLPDGSIGFRGRIDDQIQVRGFRVEPGEVEAALVDHPSVTACSVALCPGPAGEDLLIAWVVCNEPSESGAKELRSFLGARLPEPMIPARFVFLPTLPLTPNGKVDRDRLPAPPEEHRAGRAPRDPVERLVADVWSDVLGTEVADVHASFFELGGHSLKAVRVISYLREIFQVDVRVETIFREPTVAHLCAALFPEGSHRERVLAVARSLLEIGAPAQETIDGGDATTRRCSGLTERRLAALETLGRMEGAPAAPEVSGIVPRASGEPAPLSFEQERLWFVDRLAPGSPVYNVPFSLRLEGPLVPAALAATLAEIARRHEVLRSAVASSPDGPTQVPGTPGVASLPVVDLGGLRQGSRESVARRLARIEARRAFDLEAAPLHRRVLVRMAPEEHVLLLTFHHLVFDGGSVGVYIRELEALYPALRDGRSPRLPEPPIQYGDYAAWQKERLDGEVLRSRLDARARQLADAPTYLELPADRPRPSTPSFRGGVRRAASSAEAASGLQKLARDAGATPFMALLAVFAALLHRLTHRDDLLVGAPVSSREHRETRHLMGLFVNLLAVRIDLSGEPSLRELLDRVRTSALEAYAHRHLPFALLVEELRPERSLGGNPVVQVFFHLEEADRPEADLGGLAVRPETLHGGSAKFDLTLTLRDGPDGYAGRLEHSLDLFDAATVERWSRHFERILDAAVTQPDHPLGSLCFFSPAERHQILHEWARGVVGHKEPVPVHEQVAERARRAPDAVAVAGGGRWLSYGELERRASRLARRLQGLGVGTGGVVVGVHLERSLLEVVALLAVLKAGGAYLPLDPSYPEERKDFMLDDSGAFLVLASNPGDGLPSTLGCPVVDPEAGVKEAPPPVIGSDPSGRTTGPEDLAYVIYTSGSTGRPKGVEIEHRGLSNLVSWHLATFALGSGDRTTRVAGLGFDASVWELWPSLVAGAAVHLPDEEVRTDPWALQAWLLRVGITVSFVPTPVAGTLLGLEWPARAPLRTLLTGGDALNRRPSTGLPFTLVNNYGPTETTVVATSGEVSPTGSIPFRPAIGRAVHGTHTHVLDPGFRPVPVGVAGELTVGGHGLARGYRGRPARTAERFVPNPQAESPGERLYRTGDLVRFGPSGVLDFVGRTDQQLKLRGVRIEPGEIEAVLDSHPAVRASAVVPVETDVGERQLVACVVFRSGATAPWHDLRQLLEARMPAPMVPSRFLRLDSLPLSSHGKRDRSALIRLAADALPMGAGGGAPARTAMEEAVATIWCEILGLDRVGVHDDFFGLGGHSLRATQVVSRIRKALDVDLPVRSLFEAPTVASLAALIEEVRRGGESQKLPPIGRLSRERAHPLSFAQQRLWFLSELGSAWSLFNIPLAFRIRGLLQPADLARGLAGVVERHEILRSAIFLRNGEPVQMPVAAPHPPLPQVDLSGLGETERERVAQEVLVTEARRPLPLDRPPHLRPLLLRLGTHLHVLLVMTHHMVFDGWSSALLSRELMDGLRAASDGSEPRLPSLPVQYADYAVWHRERLQGERLSSLLAYWRDRLGDIPRVLDLPTDRPRPELGTYAGRTLDFSLPESLVQELTELSRREGVTLFMVLLAAYRLLLHRLTSQTWFAVGSPVANRIHPDVENLIGCFMNNLVLATDLEGCTTFRDLLERERETTLGAYDHQELPFERLVEELQPVRDLSRTPLFQVMFVLQNTPPADSSPAGLDVVPESVEASFAQFDLNLLVTRTDGELAGFWSYNSDLFDASTVTRFGRQLRSILSEVATNPRAALADAPLVAPAEIRQLVMGNGGPAEGHADGGAFDPASEPAEIESLLAEHPGVRDAVVVPRRAETGELRLVIFFEAAKMGAAGDLERRIAELWKGALELDGRVSVRDNFFELGGTSLIAVQIRGKLQELLGREIPLVELFRFPTISGLAERLRRMEDDADRLDVDGVRKRVAKQRRARRRRRAARR